jgi:hypothetical protein
LDTFFSNSQVSSYSHEIGYWFPDYENIYLKAVPAIDGLWNGSLMCNYTAWMHDNEGLNEHLVLVGP